MRYVERVQVQPTGTISKPLFPIPDREEGIAALLATIEKLPKINSTQLGLMNFATARQEVRRLTEQPLRSGPSPSLMRKKRNRMGAAMDGRIKL